MTEADPTDKEMKRDLVKRGRNMTLINLQLTMGTLPGGLNDALHYLAVVTDRHQRNAKLFLTAVLGPFERVEGLYIHRDLYRRPRRAGG